jgi:outer membrane lipoprotein-sorting protein
VTELGELLELLYGARNRFRTARGVLVRRSSRRLTQVAMVRENARLRRGRGGSSSGVMMFATSGDGSGTEPPDLQEERLCFWFEPPDRLREEGDTRTVVLDGDLWWMYSPDWGAMSNVGVSGEDASNMHAGGGELFRPLLDPSGLLALLDVERVDVDGERLIVHARPRADLQHGSLQLHLHSVAGADELELVVDRERGVVLRVAAFLDGKEMSVTEFDELSFDEVFPDGTFVFVPPPGEDVRSPEAVSHRSYSLDEAAELAGFAVFEIPELPDGQWRLHVHYSPPRERPPIQANVALFYSRSNGRATVIVSQRKAGEGGFGWSGIYPDGPPLEEVERDGVAYTVIRGDAEQGNGSSVSFDRDGTAIQLQSQELDVETLLDLAASVKRV